MNKADRFSDVPTFDLPEGAQPRSMEEINRKYGRSGRRLPEPPSVKKLIQEPEDDNQACQ